MSEPRKGIHSIRLFDVAIIDVLLTIAVAFGISKWFHKNFWIVLVCLFVIGVITHRILGIRTKVDTILYNEQPSSVSKDGGLNTGESSKRL